jgi:hypothetical protein
MMMLATCSDFIRRSLPKADVSKDSGTIWGLMVRDASLRDAPHHEEQA